MRVKYLTGMAVSRIRVIEIEEEDDSVVVVAEGEYPAGDEEADDEERLLGE